MVYSEDVKMTALILDPWILHTDRKVGSVAVIRLVNRATLHMWPGWIPSVFWSLEKPVKKKPHKKQNLKIVSSWLDLSQ